MRSCEDKLKGKTARFRLPSASQKRACLSSLMTGIQLSVATAKAKVITLTSQKGHRHYSEPIKTPSNYMGLTQSAGKRVVTIGFDLTFDWMKKWRIFFRSQSRSEVDMQNQLLFDTQTNAANMPTCSGSSCFYYLSHQIA